MNEILYVTLGVGLLTLAGTIYTNFTMRRNLKTAKYIDTITSERIKWIETIRNEFADIVTTIYLSLKIYAEDIHDKEEIIRDYEQDMQARYENDSRFFDSLTANAFRPEKERLSQRDFIKNLYLFRIRLNPNEDLEITGLIDYFIKYYTYSEYKSKQEIPIAIEKANLLVVHIQNLLKQEWENVKNESYGKIKRKNR